jgi:hypothetical protein
VTHFAAAHRPPAAVEARGARIVADPAPRRPPIAEA